MIETNNSTMEFTAHDRCDRCGAQAYSAYQNDGLELMFCLHHAKKHNLALECSGWRAFYDYEAIERIMPQKVNA